MLKKFRKYFLSALLFFPLFLFNQSNAQDKLKGEFFTIQNGGSYFEILVTNPTEIKKGEELFRKGSMFVPFGTVIKGSPNGLNFPFSWHLEPKTIVFTESSAEIYDASPYQVEAELDSWIETLGKYGPWGCRIVGMGKRKTVPLPLTFNKVPDEKVSILPISAVWDHKGSYSFSKVFGLQQLPKGIPIGKQIKINASYLGQIVGKTFITVQAPSIIERRMLKKQ
jgi:hypothetical protein